MLLLFSFEGTFHSLFERHVG